MKQRRIALTVLLLLPPAFTAPSLMAQPASIAEAQSEPETDLLAKGAYLARVGDCEACHTVAGHKPYTGGYIFHLPMGDIVSGNITPSVRYGIGSWSEKDFARAIRKGVLPDGRHLYPAMPYTSYALITDEDIHALYVYFRHVTAVDETPSQKSALKFPFNLPGLMTGWNLLNARQHPFTPDPGLDEQQNRGKYLAKGLAHCSTCHTPRTQILGENMNQYLAGTYVQNWHAPNITSDPISGLGRWSNDELAAYLKTGHADGKAQAGGPMAEAVEQSFHYLSNRDIEAIVAYLRTVPPIRVQGQKSPAWAVTEPARAEHWEVIEAGQGKADQSDYRNTTTTEGATLYNTNCASCHGISGEGSKDHIFPSLTQNSAVGSHDPTNLVMAISDGIHRQDIDYRTVMPAFSRDNQAIHNWLTPAQIASVANYVTTRFGKENANLTAAEVTHITSRTENDVPFVVRNAALLTISALLVGLVSLACLIRWIVRHSRSP
ncbi:cytochrome c [Acetobacteraceae bacterium ESL0709]|nr:cytochrome c [Acetobacteraceae bacterium ESL0697]MDF7678851.1 cytochrome c [Acetobacteraceae bacterium ESL0709]